MILKETRDHAAEIILNRPQKKNALNRELVDTFIKFLDEEENSDTSYLIIKGAGNTFCSGADLNEDLHKLFPQIRKLFTKLYLFPKPVISYVEGYCLAGGMGIIAASDLVYAHPSAKFGLPEIKSHIVPAMVYALLKPILNPHHLNELALTGEFIDAKRAYDIGLINQIGEPPVLRPTITLNKIKQMSRKLNVSPLEDFQTALQYQQT